VFASIPVNSSVSISGGGATLSFSTTTQTATGQMTHNLVAVPSGALLVLSIAGENSGNSAILGGSPTITWTKQQDSQAGSSGDAEIWTAPAGAGGAMTVLCNISAGKNSSTIYVVTGQEVTPAGSGNVGTAQAQPSVAVTTTKANSLLVCVSSDFSAQSGARTYRDTATEVLYDFQTGAYTGFHYYKVTTSIATYTEGITVPGGQQSGTAVYEIRTV
jgi:hypothetical protein